MTSCAALVPAVDSIDPFDTGSNYTLTCDDATDTQRYNRYCTFPRSSSALTAPCDSLLNSPSVANDPELAYNRFNSPLVSPGLQKEYIRYLGQLTPQFKTGTSRTLSGALRDAIIVAGPSPETLLSCTNRVHWCDTTTQLSPTFNAVPGIDNGSTFYRVFAGGVKNTTSDIITLDASNITGQYSIVDMVSGVTTSGGTHPYTGSIQSVMAVHVATNNIITFGCGSNGTNFPVQVARYNGSSTTVIELNTNVNLDSLFKSDGTGTVVGYIAATGTATAGNVRYFYDLHNSATGTPPNGGNPSGGGLITAFDFSGDGLVLCTVDTAHQYGVQRRSSLSVDFGGYTAITNISLDLNFTKWSGVYVDNDAGTVLLYNRFITSQMCISVDGGRSWAVLNRTGSSVMITGDGRPIFASPNSPFRTYPLIPSSNATDMASGQFAGLLDNGAIVSWDDDGVVQTVQGASSPNGDNSTTTLFLLVPPAVGSRAGYTIIEDMNDTSQMVISQNGRYVAIGAPYGNGCWYVFYTPPNDPNMTDWAYSEPSRETLTLTNYNTSYGLATENLSTDEQLDQRVTCLRPDDLMEVMFNTDPGSFEYQQLRPIVASCLNAYCYDISRGTTFAEDNVVARKLLETDCPSNIQICIQELNFENSTATGGISTSLDCTAGVAAPSGDCDACPVGTQCDVDAPVGFSTTCYLTCNSDADCQSGSTCETNSENLKLCRTPTGTPGQGPTTTEKPWAETDTGKAVIWSLVAVVCIGIVVLIAFAGMERLPGQKNYVEPSSTDEGVGGTQENSG